MVSKVKVEYRSIGMQPLAVSLFYLLVRRDGTKRIIRSFIIFRYYLARCYVDDNVTLFLKCRDSMYLYWVV